MPDPRLWVEQWRRVVGALVDLAFVGCGHDGYWLRVELYGDEAPAGGGGDDLARGLAGAREERDPSRSALSVGNSPVTNGRDFRLMTNRSPVLARTKRMSANAHGTRTVCRHHREETPENASTRLLRHSRARPLVASVVRSHGGQARARRARRSRPPRAPRRRPARPSRLPARGTWSTATICLVASERPTFSSRRRHSSS